MHLLDHSRLFGECLGKYRVIYKVCKALCEFVNCSKVRKVLLIFAGHKTHTKILDVINYARDNGVVLISLPLHILHKFQPLDISIFKPLNTLQLISWDL